MARNIRKKEHFGDRLERTGDFWRTVEELVTEGWTFSDFEDAGVVQDLYSFTDTTFGENIEYLRNMLLAPRHRNISAFFEWLRETLKDPTLIDSEAGRKAWVEDLEDCLSTIAGNDYELNGTLTRSGNAELYTIRREWFTASDGERDYRIIHG